MKNKASTTKRLIIDKKKNEYERKRSAWLCGIVKKRDGRDTRIEGTEGSLQKYVGKQSEVGKKNE